SASMSSPSKNDSQPRTRFVSPGRQSGTCGSECRQGQGGFPHARTQGSHPVITQRLPPRARQAANGLAKTLLSLVRSSNPVRPFSITHICTWRPVNFSAEPLLTHSSTRTPARSGTTLAPNAIHAHAPPVASPRPLFFRPVARLAADRSNEVSLRQPGD